MIGLKVHSTVVACEVLEKGFDNHMLPLVGLVGNRELMLVKHLSHFYFKNNVCYQHGKTVLELRVKALPSWVSTSLK